MFLALMASTCVSLLFISTEYTRKMSIGGFLGNDDLRILISTIVMGIMIRLLDQTKNMYWICVCCGCKLDGCRAFAWDRDGCAGAEESGVVLDGLLDPASGAACFKRRALQRILSHQRHFFPLLSSPQIYSNFPLHIRPSDIPSPTCSPKEVTSEPTHTRALISPGTTLKPSGS
jgi:hypothetical protein